MKKLNPKIVAELAKKLNKEPSTIKKDVYLLAKDYATCTKNAVAQLYARKYGKTVFPLLDKDDRASMPSVAVQKPQVLLQEAKKRQSKKQNIIQFLRLESEDSFKRDHVEEINKAYTHRIYTACFVLCRKVVEKLVLDVLEIKFPRNEGSNLLLYFDPSQGRYKDFSVLLANLSKVKKDFGPDAKLVERIVALAESFKKEANDTAHSWYYVIKKPAELDNMGVQHIVDLLQELLKKTHAAK